MASVLQGHRTAGWEAAGDEPHAPRGPAGALQRPPGCAEAHGAQLVGAPGPRPHHMFLRKRSRERWFLRAVI